VLRTFRFIFSYGYFFNYFNSGSRYFNSAGKTGQFPCRTFIGCKGIDYMDYLLFMPSDYYKDANARWPLIFFLHGKGERGNDIELVKKTWHTRITGKRK
jgi:hypothetical protein